MEEQAARAGSSRGGNRVFRGDELPSSKMSTWVTISPRWANVSWRVTRAPGWSSKGSETEAPFGPGYIQRGRSFADGWLNDALLNMKQPKFASDC